jgi:predicted ATP-grasp superfamily ATP-dependent carboligase
MSTDVPAAVQEMLRGRLDVPAYLQSFRGPVQFALMAADDPLPGVLDLPLFAYKKFYNGYRSLKEGAPLKLEELSGGSGPIR